MSINKLTDRPENEAFVIYCNMGHCPDKEAHRNYCIEAFEAGYEAAQKEMIELKKGEQE